MDPLQLSEAFFSDRIEGVSPKVSAQIFAAFKAGGLLDSNSFLKRDPRCLSSIDCIRAAATPFLRAGAACRMHIHCMQCSTLNARPRRLTVDQWQGVLKEKVPATREMSLAADNTPLPEELNVAWAGGFWAGSGLNGPEALSRRNIMQSVCFMLTFATCCH